MPYRMEGRFLEACDCYVPCPCWFDEDPDEAECTGLVAWRIENGEIDGVDVSGRSVVSVSQHGGHRGRQHQMRVVLLLDDAADDDQRRVLGEAFSGQLGGPLGELAALTAAVDAVEPATITFTDINGEAKLAAGRGVAVRSKLLRGASKRPIAVTDGVMATLLGNPGYMGRSSRFRLHVEAAGLAIDLSDRSTTSGRFSYLHRR